MSGIYALIYRLHRAGDRATARGWFQKILPVVAFMHQHLDISIQFYKRLYRRRGLFRTTRTRKTGLVPYDEHHVRYGEELMQYLDEVEAAAGVLG